MTKERKDSARCYEDLNAESESQRSICITHFLWVNYIQRTLYCVKKQQPQTCKIDIHTSFTTRIAR